MLVTINTDASFSYMFKYGAYAFLAVCNEFKITKAGIFKQKCSNPTVAEARCIVNAMRVILYAHGNITKIIVNTDSKNAIAILTNDKNEIYKWKLSYGKSIREKYHEVKGGSPNNKVVVEFRHVKAHTNTDDARSYVNDWCDKEAKKMLQKAIDNHKSNK